MIITAKLIDLTGQRFGRLVVTRFDHFERSGGIGHKNAYWFCKCDCGNTKIVTSSSLRNGATRSCGCYRKEVASKNHFKGGKSKLYNVLKMMLKRCNDPSCEFYHNYGGRGIKVCDEWSCGLDGYYNFRKWAESNGYKDGLTIDRKDNNKGYSPNNCQWVDRKYQSNNKRNNTRVTIDGRTQTLTQWCEEYNVPYSRVRKRYMDMGWDIVDALTLPKYAVQKGLDNGKHKRN